MHRIYTATSPDDHIQILEEVSLCGPLSVLFLLQSLELLSLFGMANPREISGLMPSERNLLRETSKPRCMNCNEIGRQQRLRERPRETDFQASFESGNDFLKCSVCKCHLCDICVGNLLVVIGENNNDDEWYQNAKEWFENQSLPSPPGFIGHCCEIKIMARDNKPFYSGYTVETWFRGGIVPRTVMATSSAQRLRT